ncbi:hypothetical protein JOC75_000531 [Metabacillus crassostreae]|uniref:hypothetical protein n=1 Tax=Metabacillus crassostreae TaxID=929098 RepID=UPI0019576404|nr:hypothetical protein [Metabacillus crassostreae]MBM7602561.1 hypothetical protein [Metabacillus crassostreae]
MKQWILSIGVIITIIFGGGFLIRLMRDGEFYIAEFIGGMFGIVMLLIWLFKKGSLKSDNI